MKRLEKYIAPIYWVGVLGFALSILLFIGIKIGARFSSDDAGKSRLDRLLEIQSETISLAEPRVIEENLAIESVDKHMESMSLSHKMSISDQTVSQIAIDLAERMIGATRKADRKLTTPKAEALLQVLREELAIPSSDQVEESIHAVRTRLISLTEMMVEVQSSLTNVEYEVEDVKAVVDKLPEVLRKQNDHMKSLDSSIKYLIETTATKTELGVLERELTSVKWATASAIGVLFTVVGWMMSVLLPNDQSNQQPKRANTRKPKP